MIMTEPRVLDFVLTESEGEELSVLLQPTEPITEVLPRKCVDLERAWNQLSICLRTLKHAHEVTARLKPIIGRFLLIARDNPDFYLRKGYRNYEAFLSEYVSPALQMSRSILYECRLIADRLPDLSPQEYYDLGATKVKDLAAVTTTSNSDFAELLAEAYDRNTLEFKAYLEERKLIEAGETIPVVITIPANEKIKKMWDDFSAAPAVHSKLGNANPGVILEHLLMECYFWTDDTERS